MIVASIIGVVIFGGGVYAESAHRGVGDDLSSGVGALLGEDSATTSTATLNRALEGTAVLIELPPAVGRGEFIAVSIRVPSYVQAVQGAITFSNGRVIDGHGWQSVGKATPYGGEIWTVLLGVPSTAAVGTADVQIAVDDEARRATVIHRTIEIVHREFRRERIALNGSLTSIRADPDPRKAEESRILWELLNSTDLASRYHTGRFEMPLRSVRYTSHFGDRRTYAYSDGNETAAIHNGIDLGAPTGTPIYAPAGGRVRMATSRIVTGGTIVIEHLPSVYTLYYHLHTIDVSVGDVVERGDIIGTVGSTGLSTGPHLHWEIRVSGAAVDPALLLSEPLLDTEVLHGALSSTP